jgi:hypothetical protein
MKLSELVRESRKNVDWLIVSAHWGSNWSCLPPQEHATFAHALIDAGADVIFGHSCHVFREIECSKGRPILCLAPATLSTIIRWTRWSAMTSRSSSFLLKLRGGQSLGLSLYPTLSRGCHALRAKGVDAFSISDKMKELCAALGTQTRWDQAQVCLEISGLSLEKNEERSNL